MFVFVMLVALIVLLTVLLLLLGMPAADQAVLLEALIGELLMELAGAVGIPARAGTLLGASDWIPCVGGML